VDDNITKAELNAFTESNNKAATSLEKISGTLQQFTENQEKIMERLYNGLGKEILDSICITCKKPLDAQLNVIENYVSTTKNKITWLVTILGATTFITMICTVIIQWISVLNKVGINNGNLIK